MNRYFQKIQKRNWLVPTDHKESEYEDSYIKIYNEMYSHYDWVVDKKQMKKKGTPEKHEPLSPRFLCIDHTLKISDCVRRIELDFSISASDNKEYDDASFNRRLEKLDNLMSNLELFKKNIIASKEMMEMIREGKIPEVVHEQD